jgi:tellurite resistance protein TehA-like permease
MPGLDSLGKMLLVFGGVFILLGILFILAPKVPHLGRLPGDMVFHKGSFTLYFPLVTMVLVSTGLTLLINLVLRLFRG